MNDACLEAGRAAAARGGWADAYDLLLEADGVESLRGDDLALLANVAYAVGEVDVTIGVWERAHAEGVRAGSSLSAAAAATRVAMHLLFDTAMMAPVRGWMRRAERLLEGEDETPIHAWLAVVRAYERLLSGDFAAAGEWAHRATDLGSRHDPAVAAIGRIAEARSLILAGEVRPGLELLEEAAVATVSGELDPFFTGLVYCELICALQALAQYDLAEQWTEAMERWRHGHPVGSLHGRCRVHRAEILRLRGSCMEAEEEALRACDELRPYLRRELGWPLTELGRIRLRRGDIDGAEQAFRAAHEAGWDPQPGLAMVHLARGEVAAAAASIRDALDHPLRVPSKELPPNTDLRRAPLLAVQVEVAIAGADLDRARWAADELDRVAVIFDSRPLTASAALARGQVRLAEGESSEARQAFETALALWREVGAPYESAVARSWLARAYRAGGNEERARLEASASETLFRQIGAPLDADRAAGVIRAPARTLDVLATRGGGLIDDAISAAEDRTAPPAPVVLNREGEYWSVTFEGRTVRLRDAKGVRHISQLLADPGREIHVLELVARDRGASPQPDEPGSATPLTGDAGPLLDGAAKAAYRRRLAEIVEDIEEARRHGDAEREAQADAERDFLVRELSRAVGFGGRDRRAGSASERARASVTRAVRSTIARIREHDPALATHLDRSVRTGTYCAYLPGSRLPAPTVDTL